MTTDRAYAKLQIVLTKQTMQYSMTCTCGDTQTMEASSREEAVSKFKDMMTPEAITAHFAEKHPGQTPFAKADVDSQIEQMVKEVAAA